MPGEVKPDACSVGVTLPETREVVAHAAAKVEDAAWGDADEVEPLIHAAGDLTGEEIGAGDVAGTGLPEPPTQQGVIQAEGRVHAT